MREFSEEPRIVVFQVGWVGDSVMTIPMMASLRRQWPEAHIVRVINRAMAELFAGCPLCDELVCYDRRASRLAEGLRLLRRIRAVEPDIFINLHTPDFGRPRWHYLRDNLFASMTGASARLAYAHGLDGLLLTHPLARQRFGDRNMAGELLRVAAPVCELASGDAVGYWLDDADHAAARRQLERGFALGGTPHGPFFCVSPFGKLDCKELEPEEMGGLVRRVAHELGLVPVVLGGAADLDEMARLRPHLGHPFVDLVGANGVRHAAAVMAHASLLLTIDSGLMHLGALVGAPIVALFGPTDPQRWAPFRREGVAVLRGRTRPDRGQPLARGLRPVSTPFDADEVTAAAARLARPVDPGTW